MKMAALPFLFDLRVLSKPEYFIQQPTYPISRSGANVTYELFCFGLWPSLIPFGGAARGHQLYNAQWLGKAAGGHYR